jgi:hypothetical protein
MQPDRYERLLSGAYEVVQTVTVPVQAAFLRMAVRDTANNGMGSIEIPLPLAVASPDVAGAAPAAQSAQSKKP